ncbi:transglutaminase family protein [Citreimonas sp.]|uniref:transglutaminase family protein n=1 Tax=Citreimonas sp. TaxID=3036715 RepID=UPI00405820F7
MRLSIKHSTRYRFDTPSTYGLQQLRKTPKSGHGQHVLDWITRIEGGIRELTFDDHHNNVVELISFDRGTTELEVVSEGLVMIEDTTGVVGQHRGPAPLWLYARPTDRTRLGPACRKLLRGIEGETDLERLHALSAAISKAVVYKVGASQPTWTAEDALTAGEGVCQDHTHVFLACAREMGFPARYVSGYLLMDGQVRQDAMHAWGEAHVEGLGWVGFDASNGISPDARYVRVATGLDYADAAPVTGLQVGGHGEALRVDIAVQQQ